MELPDLKQLKKVIALCRKEGVESIEIGGMKITLGAPVERPSRQGKKPLGTGEVMNPSEHVEEDRQLSPEEMLFYSAAPGPSFTNEPAEQQ